MALIQPPSRMGFKTPISASSRLALQVVDFVPGGGKTELGLEDAHLVQVDVYHGLFQLGQAEFGGLHAVPVGYINQIYL